MKTDHATAYYATDRQTFVPGANGCGWVVPPRARADELEALGRFEPPSGGDVPPGPGDLYAVLGTKHHGRTLAHTRPLPATRVGEYRTHFVTSLPADAPLFLLLAGRWADFWHQVAGAKVAGPPPIPAWGRWLGHADDAYRAWLPDHLDLFRRVAAGYWRTGPGAVYVAAPPEDVFGCVYGLARLFPARWTADLTFTTFARHPSARSAGIVGTWWSPSHRASLESVRGEPNVVLDALSGTFPPTPRLPPAAEEYIERAVRRIAADGVAPVAAFLAGPLAADLPRGDFLELTTRSHLGLEPHTLSGPQLVRELGRKNPHTVRLIFDSDAARKSVGDALSTDDEAFVGLLREKKAPEGVLADFAAEWATEAATAADPVRLRALLDTCLNEMSDGGRAGVLLSVAAGTTGVTDTRTLRTLVGWVHAVGGETALTEYRAAHHTPAAWEPLVDEPFPDAALTALLFAAVPVTPELVGRMATEGERHRAPAIRRAAKDAAFAANLVKEIVTGRVSDDDRQELLGAVLRACPDTAPRLLGVAFDAGPFDWPLFCGRYGKHFKAWNVAANRTLVREFVGTLLDSKPADWDALADVLDAFEPCRGEVGGQDRVRWDALVTLRRWVESPSLDRTEVGKLKPALAALAEWAGPDGPHRAELPVAVRAAIQSAAVSGAPVPPKVLAAWMEAYAPLVGGPAQACRAVIPPVGEKFQRHLVAALTRLAEWSEEEYGDAVGEFRDRILRTKHGDAATLIREADELVTASSWLTRRHQRENAASVPVPPVAVPIVVTPIFQPHPPTHWADDGKRADYRAWRESPTSAASWGEWATSGFLALMGVALAALAVVAILRLGAEL